MPHCDSWDDHDNNVDEDIDGGGATHVRVFIYFSIF